MVGTQVTTNPSCTLMRDFIITVDLPTLINKQHNVVKIIGIAIPGDSHFQEKAIVYNYSDL